MSAKDIQIGGGHYKAMNIQPVEFILANAMGFCEGGVVKYVCRWRTKNGIEDLRKAKHYLQLIIEAPAYLMLFWRIRKALIIAVRGEEGGMSAMTFIRENEIENPEAGVIRYIWFWNCTGHRHDLVSAMKWMDELIAVAMAAETERGDG